MANQIGRNFVGENAWFCVLESLAFSIMTVYSNYVICSTSMSTPLCHFDTCIHTPNFFVKTHALDSILDSTNFFLITFLDSKFNVVTMHAFSCHVSAASHLSLPFGKQYFLQRVSMCLLFLTVDKCCSGLTARNGAGQWPPR